MGNGFGLNSDSFIHLSDADKQEQSISVKRFGLTLSEGKSVHSCSVNKT